LLSPIRLGGGAKSRTKSSQYGLSAQDFAPGCNDFVVSAASAARQCDEFLYPGRLAAKSRDEFVVPERP
jgi:hypothetical protein